MISRLDAWLTPARRRLIHQTIGGIAAVLVVIGVAPQATITPWVAVASSALGVASMVLSVIKTRRPDMAGVYAALAALIASLAGAGVLETGAAQRWTEILAAAVTTVGPWIAAARTDPATPTGEPSAEYRASGYAGRHREED